MKIATQNSNSENVENESKNTANFITELTQKESDRQKNCLNLIASENLPSPKILELMGSAWSNKYGEGYPGKRYYAGNQFTDELEGFVQKKALEVFDTVVRFKNLESGELKYNSNLSFNPEFLGSTADYAVNVQVLSGSPANAMVFLSVLEYGDTILSLNLANGGHLSHLHATSNWNKFFKLVNYDVKLVENSKDELPNLDLETNLGKVENSKENLDGLEKIIKQIQTKIQELETKNSQSQKPFIIAIDGRGGSGKSTIAKQLTEKLDCELIEKDRYFYFEEDLNFNQETIDCQNFDWKSEEFLKDVANCQKNTIIVEGCGSFQIEKELEINLKIWVQLDEKTASERGQKRNQKNFPTANPKILSDIWRQIVTWQEKYITINLPKEQVDLVISTENSEYQIVKDNLQNDLEISEFAKDLSGLKPRPKTIHLIGLFSDSDKYSRLEDWAIMIEKAAQNGAEKVVLHLIADGIDTDKKLTDIWQEFTKILNQKSKNQKSELSENIEKLENKIYLGSLAGIDFWQKNIFTCFEALFENPGYADLSFWLKEKNYGKNYGQDFITTKSGNLQKKPNLDLIKSQIENTVDFRSENYQETDQNYLLHRFSFLENFGEFGTLENSNIINKNDTLYLINHTAQDFEKFTEILVNLNKEFDLNLNILANFESEIEGVKLFSVLNFPSLQTNNFEKKLSKSELGTNLEKESQDCETSEKENNLTKFELLDYSIYAKNPKKYSLPILKKFENESEKLWYFGVNHSYDSQDKMFATIESSFENFQPDLVILEGSLKMNSLTENYKKEILTKTKNQIITEKGEFGLGLWLALKNSTTVFCPEPSFVEQVESLEKKFKKEEIFVSFVIEMADQYAKLINEKRTLQEYVEEEITWQKENIQSLQSWQNFDFSYFNFLQNFEKITGFEFEKTLPELWNELVDPIPWEDKKYIWNILNEISKENCNFRDQFILTKTKEKIQIYNKILVIYGGSHLYVQEKALNKIILNNNQENEQKTILGKINLEPKKIQIKNILCYEIDEADFEAKLIESKPKLTILGGSSYPRLINFAKLTEIAHKHGSLVLADVAHINGLIAAGLHFSPFQSEELADFGADFVTMTTHKTLRGPRGAMIFMKKEFEKTINKTIFPGTSGGPHFNKIAAIGQACLEILGEDSYPDGVSFEDYSQNVLDTCKALENSLAQNGLEIISPTQNHLCLVKLPENSDSLEIQQKLEKIGIICNRNILPFDPKSAWKPSGLRLGTAALASRGLTTLMAQNIGKIISDLIFERETEQNLRNQVDTICQNLNWFY